MRVQLAVLGLGLLLAPAAPAQLPALIVDGQNNHKWWPQTTPVLKKMLEDTGLFRVNLATSPPRGGDMSGFLPKFADYKVIVSNYNGERWSPAAEGAFESYMRGGGGLVIVHAADNSFPDWAAYNEMIGLGGWGGRTEKHGPYLRYRDGKMVRDPKPGPGGRHGKRHAFVVTVRDPKHPITKGLPPAFLHNTDELYDSLRGPAVNLTVLATAFADPATGGSGEHEPALMTIRYGKGRVFHTTLGDNLDSMSCAAFQVTFERGAQWAATGRVTQKVPQDFPGAEKVSVRQMPR